MRGSIKRQLLVCVLGTLSLSSVLAEDRVPDSAAILARDLLTQSGVKGGLIVHLGCGDGKLTGNLRINERYRPGTCSFWNLNHEQRLQTLRGIGP